MKDGICSSSWLHAGARAHLLDTQDTHSCPLGDKEAELHQLDHLGHRKTRHGWPNPGFRTPGFPKSSCTILHRPTSLVLPPSLLPLTCVCFLPTGPGGSPRTAGWYLALMFPSREALGPRSLGSVSNSLVSVFS